MEQPTASKSSKDATAPLNGDSTIPSLNTGSANASLVKRDDIRRNAAADKDGAAKPNGQITSAVLDRCKKSTDFIHTAVSNFQDQSDLMITSTRNVDQHAWLRPALAKALGKDESNCPNIDALIKEFQRSSPPLKVDGVCGPRTLHQLFVALNGGASTGGEYGEFIMTPPGIDSEEKINLWLSGGDRSNSSAWASNLPLPTALDANEILNDPSKLAKFQGIIDRYSNGKAPITAQRFLSICQEYGMDPTLALAQAIQESNIGTQGRAAMTHNIFNVGNVNDGTNRPMSDWESGMRTYCQLMKSSYGNTAEKVIESKFQRADKAGYYCAKDSGAPDLSYADTIRGFVGEIRSAIGAEVDYSKYYASISPSVPGKSSNVRVPTGGLKPQTIAGASYIVNNFPGISEVEGYCDRNIDGTDRKSDHAKGLAVDLMVNNVSGAEGTAIAKYLAENAETMKVRQVIWNGEIWTREKGWHHFSPANGSTDDTSEHRDHVHVSFLP